MLKQDSDVCVCPSDASVCPMHEHQEEAAVIESAQTTVKHAQHNFETLLEGLLADEASQSINPPGASSRDGTFEDEEEEDVFNVNILYSLKTDSAARQSESPCAPLSAGLSSLTFTPPEYS